MGDAKLGFFASALHFHPHARLIPIRELDAGGFYDLPASSRYSSPSASEAL
jgi:hypothetical protein